jgi:uncharacterized protein YqeY
MTIKQSIEQDLKTALLGGDKDRVSVLRGIKSSILNAEIEMKKRDTGLDDQALITVLAKEAKSRQDSADLYNQGGATERAEKELKEKAIIEEYLPRQISDEELGAAIENIAGKINASGMADMGKLIGAVKAELQGQADGARIAQKAKEYLAK